jgi:hypothetical protein
MTHASSPPGQGGHRGRPNRSPTMVSQKGAHLSARDHGTLTSVEARDADLRRAVLVSLISEPCLTTRHIGVSVRGGVVTLAGYVTSNVQRDVAGAAVRRVKGVELISNTLGVAVPSAEDMPVSESGVDHRRILTLSGAFARTTEARKSAPQDAHADARS